MVRELSSQLGSFLPDLLLATHLAHCFRARCHVKKRSVGVGDDGRVGGCVRACVAVDVRRYSQRMRARMCVSLCVGNWEFGGEAMTHALVVKNSRAGVSINENFIDAFKEVQEVSELHRTPNPLRHMCVTVQD